MAPVGGELGNVYAAAARKPVFGAGVWGPGVAGGVLYWTLGFLVLPWWAALLVWWWPSIMFGAGVGFVALWLARLISRLKPVRVERPIQGGPPDG